MSRHEDASRQARLTALPSHLCAKHCWDPGAQRSPGTDTPRLLSSVCPARLALLVRQPECLWVDVVRDELDSVA
jgi:hypothetical protein